MFTVHPDEIKDFTGDQLVALLRRLLYAEARNAGVPLRGVDVPLQITVADGGQDGSIFWEGGNASTDYFPSRDIIFQCKAKDKGDAQWKREVWTKTTQRADSKVRKLNDAVKGALDRGATYIGITAKALVNPKPADRIDAIREGIEAAGGNPDKFAKIEVYEGNTLAAWASSHPAVAVWVKQINANIDLAGFSTLDHWGTRADIATPEFFDSPDRKFSLGPLEADAINFSQLADRLADALDQPRTSARLWGSPGIGKTRALYHALSTSTGLLGELTAANFIFCNFWEVGDDLWKVANQIVKERSSTVLVVDGCPLVEARLLNDIARADRSELRIITVGADGIDHDEHCVMIRPTQADRSTIRGILKAGLPSVADDEIDYLATFCDGFPRIAVLAAKTCRQTGILKSADAVAQQILQAAGAERETIRALECLSLFSRLSPDENPGAFDEIAETLVHMKGELMYENLVIAAGQHLVERNSGAMAAQPRPIADFLALRRLDYLRPSTLIKFLNSAQPHHRDAMLARWRFLARSRTLSDVVQSLLRDSTFIANIVHPDGASYLPAFVHVEPDRMGSALYQVIRSIPLDDVAAITVTDELLSALRLLASRQSSFAPAAEMVLRLAAVAPTEDSPPIVRLLRQLFQVALAGTQANDRRRRAALEQALDEDDPRIRRVSVEALSAMIQTHISRFDEFEHIGAEPYSPEWAPNDTGTINTYFDWALRRLLDIWRKDFELRDVIEERIAGEMRNLLSPELLMTLETFVEEVVAASGHWFGATHGIGDWLYFDRPEKTDEFSVAVRSLFDATLPKDPVDQVRLHSRFWMSDLHDPDKRYSQDQENPDFEYSSRRIQALAPEIARDPNQLARAIHIMAREEMNTPQVFAHALAPELPDPLSTFEQAVAALDASGTRAGANFVGALLWALDRRLADQPDEVRTLEAIAKQSAVLAANLMHIVTSLRVTDDRLDALANNVREGKITPAQSVSISYGRGLEEVSPAALRRFVGVLVDRSDGGWAALEILLMVTHDQKVIADEIRGLVKHAILSPAIAHGVEGNASKGDYIYSRMLRLLDTTGAIDNDFARRFAEQVVQACRTTGPRRGGPTDALRDALPLVMKHAPNEVWPILASFYEIATSVEREFLNGITGATKRFAFDVVRTGPGTLFDTRLELMLDWVANDPEGRIEFLLTFFPILEQKDGAWAWHPALQTLARLYGRSRRFRNALRQRIYPRSWGGSLNSHLESFKAPLAGWTDDPDLGDWASTMLDTVTRSLEDDFYGR